MPAKRITTVALLTAVALILFVVEAQIPAPVPLPGLKLGLANIITVYALFVLGPKDTLCILLVRVFLGSIFAGAIVTLFYSLGGGLLCFLAMLLLRRILTIKQIWVCSVIGAVFHNLGQMIAAVLIYRTTAVLIYLPPLLLAGIIAGTFTGLIAQYLVGRMGKTPRDK